MRKSIKDIGQYTSSDKINGIFGQIAKEQTLRRYYSRLQHVGKIGLKITYCYNPFSLNTPYQKFYMTKNIAMTISNLVDIICMPEYYNSEVLILTISM